MKRLLLSLLIAVTLSAAAAGDADSIPPLRPVMSAYTLGIGTAHLADTYLSPVRYSGLHASLDYERWQAMKFDPDRWVMRLSAGIDFDHTDNRSGNATMMAAMVSGEWGMMRRWKMGHGLTLAAGGSTSLEAGALALARNSNNPISAKAAWTVNLTGYASWDSHIGRLPFTLTYRPTLPVVGAFFSPDYGELYYEIYLGNHSGLAHCAWWGSYFRLDNALTADLHLGGTSLRLGYSCDITSTGVNHLTTRRVTHSFVIGVSGWWMSVNPRRPFNHKARTISPM